MNTPEAALVDLAGFLDQAKIPYMVIGGFANLRWGRPRLTQDLEIGSIGLPSSSTTARACGAPAWAPTRAPRQPR